MGQRVRIVLRVGRDFGKSDVASRFHELLELAVRDWSAVHPESVHRNAVDRRFFRVVLVRAHAEGAAGYRDHVVCLTSLPNEYFSAEARPCDESISLTNKREAEAIDRSVFSKAADIRCLRTGITLTRGNVATPAQPARLCQRRPRLQFETGTIL
jgi:hypothetical protein